MQHLKRQLPFRIHKKLKHRAYHLYIYYTRLKILIAMVRKSVSPWALSIDNRTSSWLTLSGASLPSLTMGEGLRTQSAEATAAIDDHITKTVIVNIGRCVSFLRKALLSTTSKNPSLRNTT